MKRFAKTFGGTVEIDPGKKYAVWVTADRWTWKFGSNLQVGDMVVTDRSRANVSVRSLEADLGNEWNYARTLPFIYETHNGTRVTQLRANLIRYAHTHATSNSEIWQTFLDSFNPAKSRAREFEGMDENALESRIFAATKADDFPMRTNGIICDLAYWQLCKVDDIEFDLKKRDTLREWIGYLRPGNDDYRLIVAPRDLRTFHALASFIPEFKPFSDDLTEYLQGKKNARQLLARNRIANYILWKYIRGSISTAVLKGREEDRQAREEEPRKDTTMTPIVRNILSRNARIMDKQTRAFRINDIVEEPDDRLCEDGFLLTDGESLDGRSLSQIFIDYYLDPLILNGITHNLIHNYMGKARPNVFTGDVVVLDIAEFAVRYFSQPERTREALERTIMSSPGYVNRYAVYERINRPEPGYYLELCAPLFEELECGNFDSVLGLSEGTSSEIIRTIEAVALLTPPEYHEYCRVMYGPSTLPKRKGKGKKARKRHRNAMHALEKKERSAERTIGGIVQIMKDRYGYEINYIAHSLGRTQARGLFANELGIISAMEAALAKDDIQSPVIIGFDPHNPKEVLYCEAAAVSGMLQRYGLARLRGYVGVPQKLITRYVGSSGGGDPRLAAFRL